jgi:hypothetical protein
MSENELRQAADRLVMDYESAGGSGNPYRHEKAANRYEDGWNVALAWLEDHPADDGEPVTEEWLVSSGLYDNWYPTVWGTPMHAPSPLGIAFSDTGRVMIRLGTTISYLGDVRVIDRGHARRLCAALGVPLKETTA